MGGKFCLISVCFKLLISPRKNTQNGFGWSNYYKKVKIKLKAMPNDLSQYATLLGHKNIGRSVKKYLYKNKYLSFRKVVVLEPAVILKMIFNSGNFPHFYKTLQNNFFSASYTYIKK